MEGEASSYVYGIYISTHLNAWCQLFYRKNYHAFQRSPCEKKGWYTNQKVMDYRHILFFRKDTYIEYLCEIILRQKISRRMLPLYSRVMALFYTVNEKHHKWSMDNLYNSDAFSKAAYDHERNYWLMVLRVKEWEA